MASTGFLDSITPWTSRSTTPKPGQGIGDESPRPRDLADGHGTDHTISHRHLLSRRDYPVGCPPASVKWFYAVDVGILDH